MFVCIPKRQNAGTMNASAIALNRLAWVPVRLTRRLPIRSAGCCRSWTPMTRCPHPGDPCRTRPPCWTCGLRSSEQRQAPQAERSGIRETYLRRSREEYVAAVGARTASALQTSSPFVERLVHFWSNHFAVSVDKLLVIGMAGAFEADAIRPNVLGRFEDMLLAVVRNPTMLLYLDQAQSIGPAPGQGSAHRTGTAGPRPQRKPGA